MTFSFSCFGCGTSFGIFSWIGAGSDGFFTTGSFFAGLALGCSSCFLGAGVGAGVGFSVGLGVVVVGFGAGFSVGLGVVVVVVVVGFGAGFSVGLGVVVVVVGFGVVVVGFGVVVVVVVTRGGKRSEFMS